MNAKELRIGNFVMQSDQVYSELPHQVVHVGDFPVLQNEKCQVISEIEFVDPIPLTQEWLIKFGAELQPWGWVLDGILIRFSSPSKGRFWIELGNGRRVDLPYVHTLQNFFALTGEELIYND